MAKKNVMSDDERAKIEARNPPMELITGRYQTTDLIAHARLDYIRSKITDQAFEAAEHRGKQIRALRIHPAEHDRHVFDPLNERWVVRWEATLE